MQRLTGSVAVWVPERAFGFITIEDPLNFKNFQKYFLHLSGITVGADKIRVGSKVTFAVNPIREGKSLNAIEVEVLDGVGGVE